MFSKSSMVKEMDKFSSSRQLFFSKQSLIFMFEGTIEKMKLAFLLLELDPVS